MGYPGKFHPLAYCGRSSIHTSGSITDSFAGRPFQANPKAPGGWIGDVLDVLDVLDDWCWIFSFRLQVSIGVA